MQTVRITVTLDLAMECASDEQAMEQAVAYVREECDGMLPVTMCEILECEVTGE